MTPKELAARHPRLFHLTVPEALPGIRARGLLPTSALLELYGVGGAARVALETRRRPESVVLNAPGLGAAVVTDNLPLSEKALVGCLDDGLSPADWMRMLNARVFFWPDEASVAGLLAARANRGKRKAIVVFDTLSIARAHMARIELSPINSGATIRKAARRGLTTFTPAAQVSYEAWRKMRGGRDSVRELTIVGGVPDASAHIVDVREAIGR